MLHDGTQAGAEMLSLFMREDSSVHTVEYNPILTYYANAAWPFAVVISAFFGCHVVPLQPNSATTGCLRNAVSTSMCQRDALQS